MALTPSGFSNDVVTELAGSDIAVLRYSLNLTQAQFAELFGVHRVTVCNWEIEIYRPSDYRVLLMRSFALARANDPEVGAQVVRLLRQPAGVARALARLLRTAYPEAA